LIIHKGGVTMTRFVLDLISVFSLCSAIIFAIKLTKIKCKDYIKNSKIGHSNIDALSDFCIAKIKQEENFLKVG